MSKDVRIWEVLKGDRLQEIPQTLLDLEARIETWLENDISILSDDLMVIGRQVTTGFGGVIDLLCIDGNGDVVIVELKRDKTPRDITAQVLDYASWVQDLSHERVTEIADQYLQEHGPLDNAFQQAFDSELPETLNGSHRMLIVASIIDPSTERIVNYLSANYGVDINAARFQYYQDGGNREFLARVFLIEPSQVEYSSRTRGGSKRRPNLTPEELHEIAEENGAGELYKQLAEGLEAFFDYRRTTRSTLVFKANIEGHQETIFSLVPGESSSDQGVRFQVYSDRLVQYVEAKRDELITAFPPGTEDYEPWKGAPPHWAGFFRTHEDIVRFLAGLRRLRTD